MSKLTVTVSEIQNMQIFNEMKAIKRYIVGDNHFGMRLSKNFTVAEIKTIVELAEQKNKEVYVSITKIFHENELDKLKDYLNSLKDLKITGIIFSDFAVYQIMKELNISFKTIYCTDTTITNNSFTELAFDNGINEIELAREITLKEILEINANKKVPLTQTIHGHVYMYHSSRQLVDNYLNFQTDKNNIQSKEFLQKENLYLYDDERKNYYPISQNQTGTHILSSEDFCGIMFIPKLIEEKIENLKLDGFGYKNSDFIKIVKIYNKIISENITDLKILETFKNEIAEITPYRKYGNGFMKKPTVY